MIELLGVNPPLPAPSSESSTPPPSVVGQQLLTWLRLLENNNTDGLDTLEQIVESLQHLIAITRRRGLLQGNQAIAEKVLASSSSSRSAGTGTSAKTNKRHGGAKRGRSNKDLTIHTAADTGDGSSNAATSGPALDEQLIMSAILRIVAFQKEQDVLLPALAGGLLTAMCTSIMSRSTADTCTIAEFELVAASGKQLLSGLEKTARNLLQRVGTVPVDEEEETMYAVESCLRASGSLVTLFGPKLSRSGLLLPELRRLGFECLTAPSNGSDRITIVVELAAKLLAAIPLTGGSDNVTPSDLWNKSLENALTILSYVLKTVAPIGSRLESQQQQQQQQANALDSIAKECLDKWVEKLKRPIAFGKIQGDSFVQLVQGLVSVISHLIARDDSYLGLGSVAISLPAAQIDCDALLGIVDVMLSFPMASEAMYHGTKKRLRSEPVEGGLVSVSVLASQVANKIKLLAHTLLDSLIVSTSSTLLPYARRILTASYSSLLDSSSATVRKVVDPSNDVHFGGGKRQRWLHNSVLVRIAAVQTFQRAILAFGCDPRKKSTCSQDVERSINLTCGCLVEELTLTKSSEGWGSLDERAELVTAAADCLRTVLSTGGDYLSLKIRGLLESTASLCLSSITKGHALSTFGSVRVSFLLFSSSCIETPWSDGAASSMMDDVIMAARYCQQDSEPQVVQATNSAIRLCEAFIFPRVSALTIITRSQQSPPAESMHQELIRANAEIEAQQARDLQRKEERERQKAETKKQQENKKRKVDNLDSKSASLKVADALPADKEAESDLVVVTEPMVVDQEITEAEATNVADAKCPAASTEAKTSGNESESDGEFPAIVDCGPDDEDV